MEYYTAKSYQSAERIGEPFEKNEKLYIKIREKCDRCVKGVYAVGVENGHIKPHPCYNGVCLKCNGTGWLYKEVRLYTEEEYNKMEEANERAKQRKAEALEAKMKAEFTNNKVKWLEENGFNEDEITYVYAGADSYQIKDELKDAGFRFSGTLKWHKATRDEKYANNLIEVKLDDLAQWSAWGKAFFNPEAKSIVEKKIAEVQPESTSEWVGEVDDKIKDIKVQLLRKYSYDSRYGMSTVYNFQTENGDLLVWFTASIKNFEIGDWIKIKYATVKEHSEYKNQKQTIIKNPRFDIN